MKNKLLLLILITASFSVQAQKEAYNWFFGLNCGLDFNTTITKNDANGVSVTGVPVNQSSPIWTSEGCFALSDNNGSLLAFSEGMNVYNKNKVQIASGLKGNLSAAQSGIIIPWPEKPGFYFIISNKQNYAENGGLFYSVLDLNGDNGNGLVTNINTPILAKAGYVLPNQFYENTMTVRHANNTDYWLVNRTGKYVFSWLITKDGFASTPEPTTITTIPGTSSGIANSEGYMKLSPDGKKICHVSIDAPSGEVLLADFDNATGGVSNFQLRSIAIGGWSVYNYMYGVEFSPNGKNLFLSQLQGSVYVLPTAEFMTATPTLLTSAISGALQLGPGGRIYASKYKSKTLGIIPNPNDAIANIKVHIFNNYLQGASEWGLPTFSPSFFDPVCYKPAITTGTPEPIKTIISTLDRTAVPRNWSDPRAGSLILESKTRGMVLTRIANPQTDIANPVEGMIVFDTTAKVLKFYNGTVWKVLEQVVRIIKFQSRSRIIGTGLDFRL